MEGLMEPLFKALIVIVLALPLWYLISQYRARTVALRAECKHLIYEYLSHRFGQTTTTNVKDLYEAIEPKTTAWLSMLRNRRTLLLSTIFEMEKAGLLTVIIKGDGERHLSAELWIPFGTYGPRVLPQHLEVLLTRKGCEELAEWLGAHN